ncbi:GH36-type glycosyl hydrolase domain-containing protein [Rubrivirga marina]|uniref:Glycosyl transferase n=1 Tax=Rubrivirga marina TaxID=1196024 RepID=A0A271IZ00_9BACT|nr:glycosyl transferase [Rubrivirga marina]PAP76432.1 hypothetical protein BSZ37_08250 [Rubrivirga marina]
MELATSTTVSPADFGRAVPPTRLLSSGPLSAAVTAGGTGVVWYEDAEGAVDLTRWRADRVEDADGVFVFFRDLDSGRVWSAGWQPLGAGGTAYEARFGPGTVEIVREDGGVETRLCLAAAGGAFVGRVTLRALDGRARRIEMTTFAEIVLHHRGADAAHPAFSKLFVQTEKVEDRPALVAKRRPRTPEDPPVWLSHWLDGAAEAVSWETDRFAFVGRGHTRRDPAALAEAGRLGGTVGAVLDPVVALRTVVDVPADVPAGEPATRAFGLAGGRSCDAVLDTAATLADLDAVAAAIRSAADSAETTRQQAGVDEATAEAAQALVGPLLFGDPGLRAPAETIAAVEPGADPGALALGGTGRRVVIRVRTDRGVAAARRLAEARATWARLGLDVEVLALCDADVLPEVVGIAGVRPVAVDAWSEADRALAAARAHVWADDAFPAPTAAPATPPTSAPRPDVPAGDLALDPSALREWNGIGGFSPDGTEYVMHLRPDSHGRLALPPLPWTNVIANEWGGSFVSEVGSASSWSANSRENRVSPWSNDPVEDPHTEALYVQDEAAGTLWSPTGGPVSANAPVEVRHGFGYSTWRTSVEGIEQHTTQSIAPDASARLTVVRLTNTSDETRRLAVAASARVVLGALASESDRMVVTERDGDTVFARNAVRGEFSERVAVACAVAPEGAEVSLTADRAAFLGRYGSPAAPRALVEGGPLDGALGAGLDPLVAHRVALDLAPGETKAIAFVLGEADTRAAAEALAARFARLGAVTEAVEATTQFWAETTGALQIETPEPALDLMANGWLLYQNLSCRLWGRTAFYQSGGAYGYRDQLQDTSALVYARPDLTRAQILRNAAHQFEEGDVLHWWHPPLSKGIRTRFADDLLWLPLLASSYAATTGDDGVFDEDVRFLTAPLLKDGQDEVFLQPTEAGTGSVYEHAARAIDRSLAVGAHGLPLMGVGDWNDGMNRVGREGRGESVWMGFFLAATLDAFLPHVEARGDQERADRYRRHRAHLQAALNDAGWDGGWYRRAFYDNGAVMGSKESDECQIDALAQAWAVLSGVAPEGRAEQALDAMEERLVDEDAGILRLLDPPFDTTPNDPGYIKGYVPGVRENGGQYTHAALWAVRALAEAGRCERAAPLLAMLSPVRHGDSPEAVATYQAEPYVIAADVYGVAPHVGRGGWTWYTGSAGWMLRVAVESILGFGIERGEAITLRPCVPESWPGFSLRYRLPDGSGTVYTIRAERGPEAGLVVDGEPAPSASGLWRVPLVRDGAEHEVVLTLA